jgi:hypothetical protein
MGDPFSGEVSSFLLLEHPTGVLVQVLLEAFNIAESLHNSLLCPTVQTQFQRQTIPPLLGLQATAVVALLY